MGLIHRQQGNLRLPGKLKKIRSGQTLRRSVDQLIVAPPRPAEHLPILLLRQSGVEIGGGNSRLGQGRDLVLHQGDKRGYHQRRPRQQQGGKLVADRLARPRGHDPQHVPPGQQSVCQFFLSEPKFAVPKMLLQRLIFIHK